MENKIKEIIKAIDRITDCWDTLSLRRTIVSLWTLFIIMQAVIILIFWMFGREMTMPFVSLIIAELGSWGTILAYYFNARGKNDVQNNVEIIKKLNREEQEQEIE